MDSEIKRLDKEVVGANRVISDLNERFGRLEQLLSTGKEFMMEIKETLSRIEHRGKWPGFSGEGDPCDWILKAEEYFKLYEIEDGDKKVALASLCMEGKALNWLMLMDAKKPIHDWEMFKYEIIQRFVTKDVSTAHLAVLSHEKRKAFIGFLIEALSLTQKVIPRLKRLILLSEFLTPDEIANLIQLKHEAMKEGKEGELESIIDAIRSSVSKAVSKPKEIGGGSSSKTEDNIKRLTQDEICKKEGPKKEKRNKKQ